jgi:hypothetical protein
MKPKEIFINGCNEIAKAFIGNGFKPLKNGQLLRKISIEKDIFSEIYFQTSQRNYSASVAIIPHISIYSKKLKEWEIEQTENEKSSGLIYHNTIGYISPYNCRKEWNLAGLTFDKNIQTIIKDIGLYIIPVINIFENKTNALEYLKINGTQFNKWTEKSLLALNFMICFGGKEMAEIFLKDYLKSCKYGNRIKHFYRELKENENINSGDFMEWEKIRIAYKNGIEI